jgi:hypothetical protein
MVPERLAQEGQLVTGMPAQRAEVRVSQPALHPETGLVTGAQTPAGYWWLRAHTGN